MFGLGWMELVIILIIVLIIFGAGKLPEIGSGLGKGIRNFKKATRGEDEIDVTPPQNKIGSEGDSATPKSESKSQTKT